MAYLTLAILPVALLIAAANDLHEFKIPNWISILLIATFPLAVISTGAPLSLLWQGLLLGAGMLVICFSLFALNVFGGGDAKLLAAASMWFGFAAQLEFILVTAFAGGILAIFILMFRKSPILPIYARMGWVMNVHQSEKGMPYGVAIAIGGLWAYPSTFLFQIIFGT